MKLLFLYLCLFFSITTLAKPPSNKFQIQICNFSREATDGVFFSYNGLPQHFNYGECSVYLPTFTGFSMVLFKTQKKMESAVVGMGNSYKFVDDYAADDMAFVLDN